MTEEEKPFWLKNFLDLLEDAGPAGAALLEDLREGLNAITNVIEFDCGGKWAVYIETAIPAAAKALWLLLIPQLDEILENYLNPKQTRGSRRERSRSRNQWRTGNRAQRRLFFAQRGGIPDTNDMFARMIPGFEAVQGRRVGPREWMFWTAVDVADRVFWYWLLFEASRTFATVWESEIRKSGECETDHRASLKANGTRCIGLGEHVLWTTFESANVEHTDGITLSTNGTVTSPPGIAFDGAIYFTSDETGEEAQREGFTGIAGAIHRCRLSGPEATNILIAEKSDSVTVEPETFLDLDISYRAPFVNAETLRFTYEKIAGGDLLVGQRCSKFKLAINITAAHEI